METVLMIATLAAALGSGLITGVFLAFSSFVMAGLRDIPAAQGIAAMQSINITVIRSLFMPVFLGTALLSAILAVVAVFQWGQAASVYLLTGGLAYVIGTFLVTGTLNVPLNNRLAVVDPETEEAGAVWHSYLRDWLWWNHLRTVFALLAAVLFTVAFAA